MHAFRSGRPPAQCLRDDAGGLRMSRARRLVLAAVAALTGATVAAVITAAAPVEAGDGFAAGNLPTANPRWGVQDNTVAPNLDETSVAWGQLPLTNPDTAAGITHYGYASTASTTTLTQDPHEDLKTEPDKNVYLVMAGHHYLYQGHEGGRRGYVTR